MHATATNPPPSTPPQSLSLPPGGVVFYDGVCGFCNKFINWVILHDHRRQLRFAPLQGSTAQSLIPAKYTQLLSTVVLHTNRGNFTHSTAVGESSSPSADHGQSPPPCSGSSPTHSETSATPSSVASATDSSANSTPAACHQRKNEHCSGIKLTAY